MEPVTRDQFFLALGNRDVHPSIRPGPWPYTTDWKLNRGIGPVIGRTEERLRQGSALTETFYFLAPAAAGESPCLSPVPNAATLPSRE